MSQRQKITLVLFAKPKGSESDLVKMFINAIHLMGGRNNCIVITEDKIDEFLINIAKVVRNANIVSNIWKKGKK